MHVLSIEVLEQLELYENVDFFVITDEFEFIPIRLRELLVEYFHHVGVHFEKHLYILVTVLHQDTLAPVLVFLQLLRIDSYLPEHSPAEVAFPLEVVGQEEVDYAV